MVYDKGFDLLLSALPQLRNDVRDNTRLVLVGGGPCREQLIRQAREIGIADIVRFEEWLEIDDFKALIACSDVFVHPARQDSYGATIFAMSLGVPVIGSLQAGAALDRIVDGVSGYLYPPENTAALARCIERLYDDPSLRQRLANNARETAQKWPPSVGRDILINSCL